MYTFSICLMPFLLVFFLLFAAAVVVVLCVWVAVCVCARRKKCNLLRPKCFFSHSASPRFQLNSFSAELSTETRQQKNQVAGKQALPPPLCVCAKWSLSQQWGDFSNSIRADNLHSHFYNLFLLQINTHTRKQNQLKLDRNACKSRESFEMTRISKRVRIPRNASKWKRNARNSRYFTQQIPIAADAMHSIDRKISFAD